MLQFEELRHHNYLIIKCYRSPFAVLSALSIMQTLKKESINFSIKFEDQDYELIIETSNKNINIGRLQSIKLVTGIVNNFIMQEEISCSCQKYIPSTYLLYSFLKRNDKLNKENLWPIIVYFSYKTLYLKKTCDYCLIFKQELINEANKFNIKYDISSSIPFFESMPIIDILLADLDYCSSIKLFSKNNIDRLYLKLAQYGIAIKHAKENYINLTLKTQKLLKNSLPKIEIFSILKDYTSLSAIEYFYWVVYFLKYNLQFNDLINSFSVEKSFKALNEISTFCKKNYKNIRKVKNWRILITNLDEELFFFKLIFDSFYKIFLKIGKQFALIIQINGKNLLITKKDYKWVNMEEFKQFLSELNEL